MKRPRIFNRCKCGKLDTSKKQERFCWRCYECEKRGRERAERNIDRGERRFLKWMAKYHADFIGTLVYAKRWSLDYYFVDESAKEFWDFQWVRGEVMPNGNVFRQFHTHNSLPGWSSRFRKYYEYFVDQKTQELKDKRQAEIDKKWRQKQDEKNDQLNKRAFLMSNKIDTSAKRFFQSVGMLNQIRKSA